MKKRWLLFLPLALLACRALFPESVLSPTQTPILEKTPSFIQTPIPEETLSSTPTLIPVATSQLEATAFVSGVDFTLVRIYPKDGLLQDQLAAEAKKAQALGQTFFVEFDATWCPPCQAITASLASKNELMFNAYRGIYLVHADVDEWGWDNPDAGFTFKAIPIFFRLDQNGKPIGTSIDGGAWGEDIPKNIAPVLAGFFHP